MDIGEALKKPKVETEDAGQQALKDLIDEVYSEGTQVGPPVEVPKEVVPKKKVPKKLKKDQVYLSTFTGGRLPKSKIDHIIEQHPVSHFSSELQILIPEVDKEYHWDPDALEILVLSDKTGERLLFQGYPGTGKTTAVRQYAAIKRKPYIPVNGKDGMEPSSLWGTPWLNEEGNMEFKLGPIPQGLKMGAIICYDEIFKTPPGILMTIQPLMERGGSLAIDDMPGTIEERTFSSEGCMIVVTDNVLGLGDDFSKAAATQIQDTSLLDRIGLTYKMEYLPSNVEEDMLMGKHPEVSREVSKLVSFGNMVRSGYSKDEMGLTLSPRGLSSILRLIEHGVPRDTALEYGYTNKLAEDVEKATVKKFINTVW